MKAQYIVAWLRHHNLAFVTAVNELMTRNSPPKLGVEPARTAKREPDRAKPQKKSEQAGWFPCRYWQLREPPALAYARALQFIHSSYERRQCSSLDIAGGHRPPLQMKLSHHKERALMTMRNKAVLAVFGILLIAATLSAQAVQPPPAPWRGAGATPCVGSDGGVIKCAPPAQVIAVRAGRLFDSKSGQMMTKQVIVLQGERISDVGPESQIKVPAGAQVIDL